MNIQNPLSQTLTCHRCKKPMVLYAQETVGSAIVLIFRCEDCDILEAIEDGKAA